MSDPHLIDPKRTAVLILDYQVGVTAMFPEAEQMCARAATLLDAARSASVPVIYVVVEFRAGHPEISPRNVAFVERVKKNNLFLTGSREAQVHPAVAPKDGDVIVVKRRIGAFSATDLETILRSANVDTLILLGVATSGAVLTTVRQAFDADYRMLLVGDCCADVDQALHLTLLEKVLGRQAQLTTSAQLAASLREVKTPAAPPA
ncbi:MAG TPA: isochorismatase family cysteine hydrolase [Polyangiaceae bacterium]|nr:isochorismatase family cysteine hydrolase [Polyangiaceae bacterium]